MVQHFSVNEELYSPGPRRDSNPESFLRGLVDNHWAEPSFTIFQKVDWRSRGQFWYRKKLDRFNHPYENFTKKSEPTTKKYLTTYNYD